MKNRQNFIFRKDAYLVTKILIPKYATKIEINSDQNGYWINVWWKSGIIEPLTIQELLQAEGKYYA